MKYDLSLFGIDKGSSVDESKISQLQRTLGVTFPESYLDLVTYADEASPAISSFSYGGEETCVSEFFSFSSEVTPHSICWYIGPGRPPNLPKSMIPIARDAGGVLICLNFETANVAVEVFDPTSKKSHTVSNNFDNFINSWRQ
ncbi:SMI1/KNR4 family protein [Pseudomonas sp. MAFF 730085]|uniref:SMI1/KNR4 family protein n=1 Tax=Pseudomonas kitaguniensis TaxID=2607908 RepID=A0A5N7JP07_9PSED|nr:SMI1/KNR4 family protein [Pseudomonas kitaguniensis]MPQ83112.1 SMI1/KNR4 family protein [Pseudomonas kitaguniensis]